MPEDEFDLDKAIEGVKASAGDFDLDKAITDARAKMETTLPTNDSPHVERPWYDFWSQYTNPTPLERSDNEAWQQAEMKRAQPELTKTFEHPASIVTRELGPGVGMMLGGPEVGELWASPLATKAVRAGVGGLAGGLTGGAHALASGESAEDVARTAGRDALMGAGVTGALDVVGSGVSAMGRGAQGAANRKLAERALSSPELTDIRAEGGGKGVSQAGQELRDLGVTKPRGILDFFRGNTPNRMSENSLDILNGARTELDRASGAVTDAPARDVSVISNDPKPVTVGQAPVDVSPVSSRLHSQADALDFAKNPDKAQTYRNLATELTTPAPAQAPRVNSSFEPVALESRVPETPDAPVSQLPIEPGVPATPDPAVLSSEPTGPIESNAPMSEYQGDNLLDVPPPTGPGEIDTTSHLANTYRASSPTVSSEPILDLEFNGVPRNPARDAGAGTANMSPSPFEDLMSNAPEPRPYPGPAPLDVPADEDLLNQVGSQLRDVPMTPGGETMPIGGHHQRRMQRLESGVPDLNANAPGVQTDLDLLSGLGEQMDMLPSQKWGAGKPVSIHDAPETFPQGQEPVDTSYWPAPYELSRNEPYSPPAELPLPPASKTVLEPAPRFKGDSPGPGLELAGQGRQDLEPDNLLAPTALYPDNPPLPQGEMAPLGMSRRAPIVSTIRHGGTEQGPRPATSSLVPGSAEPLDVSGISPTSAPMDPGRFPETPRPMTPADPSTGFTLEQLMAMRRELGNQTRNFSGRPLNKTEGDMGAATRDAWKGTGDALTGALEGHVESGNLTPDIVDAYRGANKTFSSIADVNKNLAARTNTDFKTPSTSGNETVLGGGMKATAGAAQKMLGLNAQYRLGQGIEGVGNAAQAGSDLARMGAGLGWSNTHPQIEKAKEENPGAPKAEVEQKANDSMKAQLQKAWYNMLGALHQ